MGVKWFIPLVLIGGLALAGCVTATGDRVKDAVLGKASEISAEGLVASEFYVCKAAPIGTVLKRYGHSDERAKEYKEFCNPNTEVNIVAPND
jgi:hypothetical protein